MTRRVRALVVLSSLVLLVASTAFAQEPAVPVEFSFVAGSKVVDAGDYAVSTAANGNVVLTPQKGGTAIELAPVKQISKRNVDRPELVFELVGSMWFVSEAWVPGQGGFKLATVAAAQERKSVKAPKAK